MRLAMAGPRLAATMVAVSMAQAIARNSTFAAKEPPGVQHAGKNMSTQIAGVADMMSKMASAVLGAVAGSAAGTASAGHNVTAPAASYKAESFKGGNSSSETPCPCTKKDPLDPESIVHSAKEARKELAASQEAIEKAKAQVAAGQAKLHEMLDQRPKARADIDQQQAEVHAAEARTKEMQDTMKSLQSRLQSEREGVSALTAEIQDKRAKNEARAKRIKELKAEIDRAEKELEEHNQKGFWDDWEWGASADLTVKIKAANVERTVMTNTAKAEEKSIQQKKAELDSRSKRLSQGEALVHEARQSVHEAEQQLHEEQLQLAKDLEELEELTKALKEQRALNEATIAKLMADEAARNHATVKVLDKQDDAIKHLDESRNKLGKSLRGAKMQVEQLGEANQQLTGHLYRLHRAASQKIWEMTAQAKQKDAEARQQLREVKQAAHEKHLEVQRVRGELDDSIRNLHRTTQYVGRLQDNVASKEGVIKAHQEMSDNLRSSLGDTSNQLKQERIKVAVQGEAMQGMMKEIGRQDEHLHAAAARDIDNLRALSDARDQLARRDAELHAKERHANEQSRALSKMSQGMADQEQKIMQHEQTVRQKSEELRLAKETIDAKDTMARHMNDALASQKTSLDSIEAALKATRAQLARCQGMPLEDQMTEKLNKFVGALTNSR